MGLENLKGYAIAVATLAVIDLMAIAVVTAFKDTNLVENDTADQFVSGLAYFGLFVGVLVIAVIGKAVIGLWKKDSM